MQSTPTIYIVDDDDAVRHSLGLLVETLGYKIKSFPSVENFLSISIDSQPTCLLLDIHFPEMSGLDLQEKIINTTRNIPIIFITGFSDVPTAVQATQNGAVDFLEKPTNRHLLGECIKNALKQDIRNLHIHQKQLEIDQKLSQLSPRELEIMVLIVNGLSSKQVADQLRLSIKTVALHRAHLMKKLNAESVVHLVHLVTVPSLLPKS